MPFEAILHEVEQLHNVSTRLQGLADQHPRVSESSHDDRGKRSQHRHYLGSRSGDETPEADLSAAERPASINLKWRSR
jgi:hypothetical protein